MVENDGPVPALDRDTSNSSIPGATVVFDALEHPRELELELESNLHEDEEHGEDGDNSEVSEEGEAEGEETVYKFQFEGEMDPLSFGEEEDSSGMQPYERFEQMQHDYEVLAAKKRPALQKSVRYAFILT